MGGARVMFHYPYTAVTPAMAVTNPVIDFGAESYAIEGNRPADEHFSLAGDELIIRGTVVQFQDEICLSSSNQAQSLMAFDDRCKRRLQVPAFET